MYRRLKGNYWQAGLSVGQIKVDNHTLKIGSDFLKLVEAFSHSSLSHSSSPLWTLCFSTRGVLRKAGPGSSIISFLLQNMTFRRIVLRNELHPDRENKPFSKGYKFSTIRRIYLFTNLPVPSCCTCIENTSVENTFTVNIYDSGSWLSTFLLTLCTDGILSSQGGPCVFLCCRHF